MQRSKLRKLGLLLGGLLILYVASYFVLSRLGLRAEEKYDIDGFMYVDYAPLPGRSDREVALRYLTNHYLDILYRPAWLVDFHLLGGPGSATEVTFIRLEPAGSQSSSAATAQQEQDSDD